MNNWNVCIIAGYISRSVHVAGRVGITIGRGERRRFSSRLILRIRQRRQQRFRFRQRRQRGDRRGRRPGLVQRKWQRARGLGGGRLGRRRVLPRVICRASHGGSARLGQLADCLRWPAAQPRTQPARHPPLGPQYLGTEAQTRLVKPIGHQTGFQQQLPQRGRRPEQ